MNMRKYGKIFLVGLLSIGIVACGGKNTSNSSSSESSIISSQESTVSSSVSSSSIQEEMYTVYSGANEVKLQTSNIWTAIILAGKNSKSSDRYYVNDKDGNVVFKYSLVNYYKYQGTTYVGSTTDVEEAKSWSRLHPDSYVVDGKGYEFIALGSNKINTTSSSVRGYELFTGSYSYLFSNKYTKNPNQLGYTYISFTLKFSQAQLTYHTENTEAGWNAYVFVNIMLDSPWQNCDIGIANNWEGNKGLWGPVFNFNGNTYSPDQTAVITQMDYDPSTNTYKDADDLFFEIYATKEQYVLNITNLTTMRKFHFTANNPSLMNNVQKSYILLAASYCPVQINTKLWNPRSGASFTNIIFENTKVAQYKEDGDYSNAIKYDFGPSSTALDYGLVQGADNADYFYGVYESDGTYENGSSYKQGDTYYGVNIYYDYRER
jgi:hypothetical protein